MTAPSDLARTTLLSWLDEFLAAHPGLELALLVRDLPLDVMREEVDVAIRYGNMADSGLVARLLATTHPVLCASPDYLKRHGTPLHPEDLPRHNCITFDRGGRRHRDWRFARGGAWTEVRVSGDRHADDASLAREWAIAGAGLLFKTELDVRHDLERGALVRLLSDWRTEPYPLHAVIPSGRFVPARVRALVDFLALKFSSWRAPRS
ncbi:substrate binding domain-containing protein [Cystobacter fuscus]